MAGLNLRSGAVFALLTVGASAFVAPAPAARVLAVRSVHPARSWVVERSIVRMMAAKPTKSEAPVEPRAQDPNSKRNQQILFGLVIFGILYDFFITHHGLTNFDPSHGP